MSRFGKRDVTSIIEFLEKELDSVSRLEKVEKMKLRSKIRQQENWLIAAEDPKPDKILVKLEGRLGEIFRLFPHGVKDKLTELLEMKISRLDKNAPS
jgi:hypothetical protein